MDWRLPDKFYNLLIVNPLTPFGILYGLAMRIRNRMYDRGILRSYSLGARTISIGNLTTGGTGKTPLVALTAQILAENGEKVCVLIRGYGRANENKRVLVSDGQSVLADAATGGDEPVELARKLIGKAVVVADADRLSAAKWAKERFGITAFVLDDGFQHRRVKRDLDIVCIDATQPLTGVLPAGRLRESTAALQRADAVIITRVDLADNISDLRFQISNYAPTASIFSSENTVLGLAPLSEYHSECGKGWPNESLNRVLKRLREERLPDWPDEEIRLFAFCALGNPENFFLLLDGQFEKDDMEDFDLSITKAFSDHHPYTQQDIDDLQKQAREYKVDAFVTTAKDAVKLITLKFDIPCYVIEIEPRLDRPDDFRRLVTSS